MIKKEISHVMGRINNLCLDKLLFVTISTTYLHCKKTKTNNNNNNKTHNVTVLHSGLIDQLNTLFTQVVFGKQLVVKDLTMTRYSVHVCVSG